MAERELKIEPCRCKSCGLCVRACPHGCLELSDVRNDAGYFVISFSKAAQCIACGICVRTCPEPQCLELVERGKA